MGQDIFLGQPPESIVQWFKNTFNVWYKTEGISSWQFYTPTSNDISSIGEGVASFTAAGFKQMDSFDQVREVKIPRQGIQDRRVLEIQRIEQKAFSGCSSLVEVTVPDTVKTIGQEAFIGCTSLEAISMPSAVEEVGGKAFQDCTSLTAVNVSDSLSAIPEYMCTGCTSLQSITIPDSVVEIGVRALFNCQSLEHIDLPSSLVHICDGAFQQSGLKDIEIGSDVSCIDVNAFLSCGSLSDVYFHGRAASQISSIPDQFGQLQYPWGMPDPAAIRPGVVASEIQS